jgi:long-chain acyl-CoA synthetase
MSMVVRFSTITEMFHHLVLLYASSDRPYLMRKIDGTYTGLTHTQVVDLALGFAAGLRGLGVKKGDRVAILAENRPEWVVSDIAIQLLGAVSVPIFPSQTAKQIAYILHDAGAVGIVVSNMLQLTKVLKTRGEVRSLRHVIMMNEVQAAEREAGVRHFGGLADEGRRGKDYDADLLRKAAQATKPEDLCTIIYTSGTTGDPKGVMLSHRNLASNITAAADLLPIGPTDVLLSFLPLCHVFERMAGYYTASACGSTIAFAESIESVSENLLEVHPTIVVAVPRLFERIYSRLARKIEKDPPARRKIFYWAVGVGRRYRAAQRHGRVPVALRASHTVAERLVFSKVKERVGGRLRFFVSGGAALPRELGEFFEAVGMIIIEGYGLTESSPVISCNRMDAYRFGSVGYAIPGVEVRIAEDGEILTRGPHVMVGYYNNRKATEEAIDRQGWLHTGDVGMIDDAGFIYITDRKKHLFVSSGGKNIAPQPIEGLFAGSPFIDQFVLVGDRRMFLSALIVPNFEALREYADAHGIPYRDVEDLVKNKEINDLIEKTIQGTQKDLANFEKVRRFALLPNPLTIENGELTPSLKLRRKQIEERYSDLIDAMYQT